MILVLHGSNIDGKTIRTWTGYGFDELADRYGFIVLYPDGYKQNWNDCRINAPFPANKENIDDVGFMRALVEQFQTEQGVDPAKVFAFGYSNGGQMVFRLALEELRIVAAVTAIGANLPTPDNFACAGHSPTARVMLVNGTADPIMPYEGGEVTLFGFASRGTALSARATAEYFAERNGLTSAPVAAPGNAQTGNGHLPVSQLIWIGAAPSQAGQSIVELYTVKGGGHVVPQPKFRFPRINGKTATNLDTPAVAVAFFGLMHERFS
ncbi:MAG: dienelactone hydrolase family protein [Bacteroidetes bacterium]|nr:dienelactone hydrolase family protein [Fibrella sp.]